MADRISVVIALPRDEALPADVQGVGLRRLAIDLMKEIAEVKENSVRLRGATEDATIQFGGDIGTVSTWQRNLLAVRFIADGKALEGVCGPVIHGDNVTRVYSVAAVNRDEFAA